MKVIADIKNNPNLFGMGFVFFASMVLFLIERHNHGINLDDFEVYYRAATRIWNGENLYQIPGDGHFVFKYSPAFAVMFIPFIVVPFPVAKILFWLLLTGIAAASLILCLKFASPGLNIRSPKRFNLYIVLLTLSSGLFLYREFVLGQVNMILFMSYLLMIKYYQLKKPVPLALIWAAGIMFKPWGLIFLPYFLLKKEFRVVAGFAGFTILLFVIPVLFYGYTDMLEQTGKWFHELSVELGYKHDPGSRYNFTIFSVLYRYTPLRFIEISGYWRFVYQFIVLGVLGILVLLFIRKGTDIERYEVASGALLIGLMPLIAQPNYNAFILVGLALAIVIVHYKSLPIWCKVLLPVGILFLGGNYNEVWGAQLSDRFLELSFVSIGAMVVLISLFLVRWKKLA